MANDNTKKKPEVRHVSKFMQGRMTPQELHQAIGIRKKCVGCGQPAVIRIKVMVELKELTRRQPQYVAGIAASNPEGPFVPTIKTSYGDMVKVSDVGACSLCQKEAEVTAARDAPSWALVEIDRGPGKDKAQVSVPSSIVNPSSIIH